MSNSSKETKRFQISPNMIFHTINNQAGSIEKAILECLMNAVDAGATKVEVDFNENGIDYSVKDNGKGFRTKKEIEDCFGVFGFDHGTPEQNHRTYGTFGIGRAQLWAFSKNIWKTNEFILDVDIKNKGLDYDLIESSEKVKGCHILGNFYERQSASTIQNISRELIKLALYLPIDFFLDGKLVSKKCSEATWDHETDKAYVKFNETGDLKIYNQGVYVMSYPNYKFGKGGVINSKVALTLNTARNDILLAQCEVWKNIRSFVEEKTIKDTVKKEVFNSDQSKTLFLKWIDADLHSDDIMDKKIFPDVKGKYVSLKYISKFKQVTISKTKGSQIGENIQNKKLAFVFSPDVLGYMTDDAEDFINLLNKALARDCNYEWNKKVLTYQSFDKVSQTINGNFDVLEPKKLTKKQKVHLEILETMSHRVSSLISDINRKSFDDVVRPRQIRIGVTDLSAEAWTDGMSYISFSAKFLSENMEKGLGGMLRVLNVMVHEYLHNKPSTDDHIHSFEFYEKFHDILTDYARELTQFQKEAGLRLTHLYRKNDLSIPRSFEREDGLLDEEKTAI